MPISLQCSSCKKQFKAPDAPKARAHRCPVCQAKLTPVDTPTPGYPDLLDAPNLSVEMPPLPKMIGRFEVRERLGAGAFGQVYRAYDPKLDREVALKVPHADLMVNPKIAERFLREARAGARLTHPNIVAVHDTGFDGTHYYIVSAYVKGRTLKDELEQGPWDIRRSVETVRLLAEALAYAHKEGIVHRDVKPANILIDEKGQPRLMDFGIASLEDAKRVTQIGAPLGTPAYMSPEQAQGTAPRDASPCDQYSLGVVLYEMLCGQVPFEGPPGFVVSSHLHREPPKPRTLNADIPQVLESICLRALDKLSRNRHVDCEALALALQEWLKAPLEQLPAVGQTKHAVQPGLPYVAAMATKQSPRKKGSISPNEKRLPKQLYARVKLAAGVGLLCAASIVCLGSVAFWISSRPSEGDPIVQSANTNEKDFDLDKDKSKDKGIAKSKDAQASKGDDKTKPSKVIFPDIKVIPVEPIQVAYSPADMRQVRVGKQVQPSIKEPAVLLQKHEKQGWTRVPNKDDPISAGRLLLSLSGSKNVLALDSGIELTLWGVLPELALENDSELECRAILHLAPAPLSADLTLERGRIILRNKQADGKDATIRLRHNDPTQNKETFLDITLFGPNAAVIVERTCHIDREEPFYENEKDAKRLGPTAIIGIYAFSGSANVRAGEVTDALIEMQRPALQWHSRHGKLGPAAWVPGWLKGTPDLKEETDKLARTTAIKAHDDLVKALDSKAINVALAELKRDVQKSTALMGPGKAMPLDTYIQWRYAIRCFAAIDDVASIYDEFANAETPISIRGLDIQILKRWIAWTRAHDYELLSEISRVQKKAVAVRIMELFHMISTADADERATYEILIDGLNNDVLPIRTLSHWHLLSLMPQGGKILFDPTMPRERRIAAQQAWTALLAPPPKKTPEMPVKTGTRVGDFAPMFEGPDDTGKSLKSSEVIGKKIVVLYFYPADFTGGCTAQACGFRDEVENLKSANVFVVGVSGDSVATHRLFKTHYKLNFPLLADEEGNIAKTFGVGIAKGGMSPTIVDGIKGPPAFRGVTIHRHTVIIDLAGRIAASDKVIDAGGEAKRIADIVKKLDSK